MGLLSVVIITFNEAKNIGRCIDSVRPVADEIVVLDSYSTDDTVNIAKAKGAIVHSSGFDGYIHQKNKALTFASHDHILSLDADEELDQALVASILKVKKEDFPFKAYRMNRCAFYCGKFIRHGTWYPEPKVRLFDRRFVTWGGLDPHDRIIFPSTVAVSSLKGDILHYICNTVEEHQARNENFSTLAARSLHQLGRHTNWLKIIASPSWFFVFDYLVRGGFLSGKQGWWIAKNQARYHYLKYLKLYWMNKRII